jgi:cell wall-associated NlpC family hydrolase
MSKHVGRHRAPGFSPLHEISQIAADSAKPVMQVSVVAVASTGLIATMTIPAHAATDSNASSSAASAVTSGSAGSVPSEDLAAATGPLVTAPATGNAMPKFGSLRGFRTKAAVTATTVAAPAPARVSRTTTRSAPTSTPAAAVPTAPAPAVTGGRADIIAIAASLTGIPYRYGGTSTSGIDCSGYTQLVYARAGISIPRTAEGQRAASIKVANPAPGDLIFFGRPATHAGIYAGNGMMYDAGATGRYTSYRKIYTFVNVSYGRF